MARHRRLPVDTDAAVGPLRVGAVPGATPGRWIDTWRERMPRTPIELVPVAAADAGQALAAEEIDIAIVRTPLDRDGMSVIPLYDEQTVVVFPRDSHLAAADELDIADLAGETLIVPGDDVLSLRVPGADAPGFDPPADTEEAVAIVAAGIGVMALPMSIARLHQRRDLDRRVLRDAPVSPVGLAWPTVRTTPAVEAFVGIVRGRTENSSR